MPSHIILYFFTSFYFFHSSRPFPRSFYFFLLVSHWVTLESVFVPLNTIKKKHWDSFDNFPPWKELSRICWKKSLNVPFMPTFYSEYRYIYGCREISMILDKSWKLLRQHHNNHAIILIFFLEIDIRYNFLYIQYRYV